MPDPTLWREFDPAGEADGIYNRYAFSTFVIARGNHEFRLAPPVAYSLDILPADPLLSKHGVRYAAFPDEVSDPGAIGLRLVSNPSGARLWIYQVVSAP